MRYYQAIYEDNFGRKLAVQYGVVMKKYDGLKNGPLRSGLESMQSILSLGGERLIYFIEELKCVRLINGLRVRIRFEISLLVVH